MALGDSRDPQRMNCGNKHRGRVWEGEEEGTKGGTMDR